MWLSIAKKTCALDMIMHFVTSNLFNVFQAQNERMTNADTFRTKTKSIFIIDYFISIFIIHLKLTQKKRIPRSKRFCVGMSYENASASICAHSTKMQLVKSRRSRVWNPQLVCGMESTRSVECNQSEGGYTLTRDAIHLRRLHTHLRWDNMPIHRIE